MYEECMLLIADAAIDYFLDEEPYPELFYWWEWVKECIVTTGVWL